MTVVLMHGKAFGGYYFENVIKALTSAGYRAIVPDQIGGASHRSLMFMTASSCWPLTRRPCLITSASATWRFWVTATGGMTAVRFTLMNPDRVTHLVRKDPLGACRLPHRHPAAV